MAPLTSPHVPPDFHPGRPRPASQDASPADAPLPNALVAANVLPCDRCLLRSGRADAATHPPATGDRSANRQRRRRRVRGDSFGDLAAPAGAGRRGARRGGEGRSSADLPRPSLGAAEAADRDRPVLDRRAGPARRRRAAAEETKMSYSKTVTLPVSPDEAFALVTEPERLRRWKTVSAYVDLRAGGAYRWTINPGHTVAGTFREVEPGRRIVYGWGWEGSDELPPDASTVTVTIEPDPAGSRVTLSHHGLSPEQAAMHAEGWNHYLERLERLATTGDAGLDEWAWGPEELSPPNTADAAPPAAPALDEWAWAPEDLSPTTAADAALAAVQPVLRNVKADDLSRPTPCENFTCEALADHLIGSLAQLGAMAGTRVSVPQEGSLEERVSVAAAQAIDAWRSVDLDGSVPGPGGSPMPASFLAGVLPVELLIHGWDLAQAIGQRLQVSDELVSYVWTLAEAVVPPGRGRSFDNEVTPAPDAVAVDRLAAYTGRSPVSV